MALDDFCATRPSARTRSSSTVEASAPRSLTFCHSPSRDFRRWHSTNARLPLHAVACCCLLLLTPALPCRLRRGPRRGCPSRALPTPARAEAGVAHASFALLLLLLLRLLLCVRAHLVDARGTRVFLISASSSFFLASGVSAQRCPRRRPGRSDEEASSCDAFDGAALPGRVPRLPEGEVLRLHQAGGALHHVRRPHARGPFVFRVAFDEVMLAI